MKQSELIFGSLGDNIPFIESIKYLSNLSENELLSIQKVYLESKYRYYYHDHVDKFVKTANLSFKEAHGLFHLIDLLSYRIVPNHSVHDIILALSELISEKIINLDGFLKRFKSAFKDFLPKSNYDILHICAGRLPKEEGTTLDIDKKYDPDILSDAEDMSQLNDESFPWVIADPPYNENASQKYYGRPLLKKSQMIREMTRVCKVNGFIALLDQYSPNSFPRCLKRIALIGVTSVPNTDMRIFTVWQKEKKFETATTTSKKKKQKE